ncbi:hypothetical protein K8Q98_00685 [Candidatus Nomurabacteria bacterium]|nr:hypothetical protein [Candidatus Nomurabacteria bacterium]
MNNFIGTIIEESLEDKAILGKIKIISTRVSKVTEKHKTPWLKQWTLHKVEIPEEVAAAIAEDMSRLIDKEHFQSWYADFKNDNTHFVIYRDKVFKINRDNNEEYDIAAKYGLDLGIPSYQIDFEKHKKW